MNHTEAVVATHTPDNGHTGQPGSYSIRETETDQWISFTCSCGCGYMSLLPLTGPYRWEWDGNRERPTLQPSIRQMAGCKWHGYLTNGVWIPQPDSGK